MVFTAVWELTAAVELTAVLEFDRATVEMTELTGGTESGSMSFSPRPTILDNLSRHSTGSTGPARVLL